MRDVDAEKSTKGAHSHYLSVPHSPCSCCHLPQVPASDTASSNCALFKKEFVPSLLYGGVSRVKSTDCLQVLDFHPSQLLKSDPKVIQQCSSSIGETSPDMKCCKLKILEDDSLFCAYDRFESEEGGLDGLYIKKRKIKTNKQPKRILTDQNSAGRSLLVRESILFLTTKSHCSRF